MTRWILALWLAVGLYGPGAYAQEMQQLVVVSTTPADGTTDVALATTVQITFNRPVDPFELEDLVEVSPEGAITLGEATVVGDGRTVAFEVTHQADTDYSWVLYGTYYDPELDEDLVVVPFVLHYTTASDFGSHTVRGRVVEREAPGKTEAYEAAARFVLAHQARPRAAALLQDARARLQAHGQQEGPAAAKTAQQSVVGTVVYLADVNIMDTTDVGFQGATVVTNPLGTYEVPYVRDGVYWPVAIRVEATGDDEPIGDLSGTSMGFYDPDADGQPDSIVVAGQDVAGVEIGLVSVAAFAETARVLEAEARAVAALEADDQQLVGMAAPLVDPAGTSFIWTFSYYAPSQGTLTYVEASPFDISTDVQAYDGEEPPPALPTTYVDSDVAMQVAMAEGGSAFLAEHPQALTVLSAGLDDGEFFFGTEPPAAAAWTALFLGFSESGFEYLAVYVDLETGAFLGSDRNQSAATVRSVLDEARAAVDSLAADVRLVAFGSYDITPDGTASSWAFQFYAPATDVLYEVYFSPFGPPEVAVTTEAGLQDVEALPEGFLDSDAALQAALGAGGQRFLEQFEDGSLILQAGYFGDSYPELGPQAVYLASFYAYTEAGEEAFLDVVLDLETGAVLHTAHEGYDTAREDAPEVPRAAELMQNYPNPFNPETVLPFRLAQPAHVTLAVYDALGRQVQVLVDRMMPAGTHEVHWRPGDLAGGLYFYRLSAAGVTQARALMLHK